MFRIKYQIISKNLFNNQALSKEHLHYDIFLGNVQFLSIDREIKMNWEWIPIFDLAFCLQQISFALGNLPSGEEYFEFTENVETIIFSKNNCTLVIKTSFSSVILEVDFGEFKSEVYSFYNSIYKEIECDLAITLSDIL